MEEGKAMDEGKGRRSASFEALLGRPGAGRQGAGEADREQQAIEETSRFFQKVYGWMFLGLLISGETAYWVASEPSMVELFVLNDLIQVLLVIAQLALIYGIVRYTRRISASAAVLMFCLYCFMTGLTLSVIFLVFDVRSIALAFFISAGMFAAMSIYGYLTRADLTRVGQVLLMGLFGLVIAHLANLYMQSDRLSYIVSFIGVVVFTGLTAYDTQKIREANVLGNEGTPEDLKESIVGALDLYLDYVNLFLDLLSLLGKKKE